VAAFLTLLQQAFQERMKSASGLPA